MGMDGKKSAARVGSGSIVPPARTTVRTYTA
jgi:hypothetical protein